MLTFQRAADFGDTTGYLAIDETNEMIVLSFRGSSNLENWIANLDVLKTSLPNFCDGCEAHSGFWNAWETVADELTAQIDGAIIDYPSYQLVFTGHSLGAALATLAGTALRTIGYELELVSLFSSEMRGT